MKKTQAYLFPDYYPHFACKMGKCRAPCCEGWPISITMSDYFKLLGAPCSPHLRSRLDTALHLSPHPTPEEYAQILPRYDGKCPLHLPDGRCGIHAELGEEHLSCVCRLYPRGIRPDEEPECSCANSCEAVPEMLLERHEPLTFQQGVFTYDLPQPPRRSIHFATDGRPQDIRLWLIGRMQDRRYPFPRRLAVLGFALHAMDEALTAGDRQTVERLLTGEPGYDVPQPPRPTHRELQQGLETAEKMLEIMDEQSVSIRAFGRQALACFGKGGDAFDRYREADAHFEGLIPNWQTWFEHLLVNHMFFSRFPFQDRPVALKEEYIALCAVYMLLRFLCLGCSYGQDSTEVCVDAAAAAFRLIEHTDFDRYAALLLKELGYGYPRQMLPLICL